MADKISSALCADVPELAVSDRGGDRDNRKVGDGEVVMGGRIISPPRGGPRTIPFEIPSPSPRGETGAGAGGTSIRKLTCMCLFILDPFMPCHTAGPAFLASGTGPGEYLLAFVVGDPGQETGGEAVCGGDF